MKHPYKFFKFNILNAFNILTPYVGYEHVGDWSSVLIIDDYADTPNHVVYGQFFGPRAEGRMIDIIDNIPHLALSRKELKRMFKSKQIFYNTDVETDPYKEIKLGLEDVFGIGTRTAYSYEGKLSLWQRIRRLL
jgi:hypothetical protein